MDGATGNSAYFPLLTGPSPSTRKCPIVQSGRYMARFKSTAPALGSHPLRLSADAPAAQRRAASSPGAEPAHSGLCLERTPLAAALLQGERRRPHLLSWRSEEAPLASSPEVTAPPLLGRCLHRFTRLRASKTPTQSSQRLMLLSHFRSRAVRLSRHGVRTARPQAQCALHPRSTH